MVSVVVFGQGMQLPMVIPCLVDLDMTDETTMNMVVAVISESMSAVVVGREHARHGIAVTYRVQCLTVTGYTEPAKPEDN